MNLLKTVLIVSSFIVVATIVWIFIRVPSGDPEKPINVPKDAFWKGNMEEGFWFLLNSIDSVGKKYRFKIFTDYNGELVMDADFKLKKPCDAQIPMTDRVADKIKYFEFDKIVLDSCTLEIIYPAYGGTFWEMEKNDRR